MSTQPPVRGQGVGPKGRPEPSIVPVSSIPPITRAGQPVDAILNSQRPRQGRDWTWKPRSEDVGSVPSNVGWLYISGSFSLSQLELLVRSREKLWMVEVTPSQGWRNEARLRALLEGTGIGLRFARRHREYSKERDPRQNS